MKPARIRRRRLEPAEGHDHHVHGVASKQAQAELEQQAAARIFGLLPQNQGSELLNLWHEFENAETDDARFAKALDRFQPLLVNVFTGGGTWSENGVTRLQVMERYGPAIATGAPRLWAVCEEWVQSHFDGNSSAIATDQRE